MSSPFLAQGITVDAVKGGGHVFKGWPGSAKHMLEL